MIRGRAISLRVIRESDLEALLELDNDLVRKGDHLPHRLTSGPAFRKQFQETGLLSEEAGRLLIVDGEDRLVGSVGYFRPNHYIDGYELGYSVYEPIRRGRGIGTEAVGLLVGWLFSTKKIARVQAALIPENVPSRKVLERNGFRLEGVIRRAIFMQGKSSDAELWSILREEWEERRTAPPSPG
jgi:[ribosomal protein S5]-alanine N-acetyltransferase